MDEVGELLPGTVAFEVDLCRGRLEDLPVKVSDDEIVTNFFSTFEPWFC